MTARYGSDGSFNRPEDVALAAMTRMATAIMVVSSKGKIAYANRAADSLGAVLFDRRGLASKSLVGCNIADVSAKAHEIFSNSPLSLSALVHDVLAADSQNVIHRSYTLIVSSSEAGHAGIEDSIQLPMEIQTWTEAEATFVTLLINTSAADGGLSNPKPQTQKEDCQILERSSQIDTPRRPLLARGYSEVSRSGKSGSLSDVESASYLAKEFSKFAEATYRNCAERTAGFILFADERFCFPNYLGGSVAPVEIDDINTFWADIPCFDADFERKLPFSEYPSMILNQDHRNFVQRYGTLDENGRRIILETTAECLWSEPKGEGEERKYLGSVTWNRTVGFYEEVKEREMQERLASFETICECMPHMIWTCTPEGLVDFASKSYRAWTGLEGNLEYAWKDAIHPDDCPRLNAGFKICLDEGIEGGLDVRYKRHDGVFRWTMVKCRPLNDANGNVLKFYGTVTDVHEIVNARLESAQWRAQMMAMVSKSDMNFFCVDTDWNVTLAEGNLHWMAEDGSVNTKTTVQGNDLRDHMKSLHPNGMPIWENAIQEVMNGKERQIAEGYIGGRWLHTILGPLLGQKNGMTEIQGVLGITTDQTESRTLVAVERENARLLIEEQSARENDKMKSQFLAHMSHELRSPLNGILGMTALLFNTGLGVEQQEYADDIHSSAQNLLIIVNDLLDFAKIEAGSFQVEEIPLRPADVVDAIVRGFRHTAQQKNLKIDIHYEIPRDLVMLGDSVRIMQILNNLFTNAIKFTSAGSISLSVKTIENEDVRSLEFTVQDSGIGIDEATIKKLFLPFGQGDSSTARKFGGTGLGLVISRNVSFTL